MLSQKKTSQRLLSLDILRGLTVVGMIIVNNAGGDYSYDYLQHSAWNGLTPCDLVFPFFLFIMGISTYIALQKYDFRWSSAVGYKIVRRMLLILLIGWGIYVIEHLLRGDFNPWGHLRLTGVLPRIALCYGITSLLALAFRRTNLMILAACILLGYTALLMLGNGYAMDETNVICQTDRLLIGADHLYTKKPIDPEGLLSTLPCIAHTIIGFLCGSVIMGRKKTTEQSSVQQAEKSFVSWAEKSFVQQTEKSFVSQTEKDASQTRLLQTIVNLFVIGFLLFAGGYLLTEALPMNKRIWSPTFALVTCGLAAMLQATLIYIIDWKGKKRWCRFFEVFGVNPLFLYVLSELTAVALGSFGLKVSIYEGIHVLIGNEYLASAVYSCLFALVMGACGWPLYRKKIYIKI